MLHWSRLASYGNLYISMTISGLSPDRCICDVLWFSREHKKVDDGAGKSCQKSGMFRVGSQPIFFVDFGSGSVLGQVVYGYMVGPVAWALIWTCFSGIVLGLFLKASVLCMFLRPSVFT